MKCPLFLTLALGVNSFTFTSPTSSLSLTALDAHKLLLIRHGESDWNKKNIFTGWANVPLSPDGEEEAEAGGKLIAEEGIEFDVAYTSFLQRAQNTLKIAQKAMGTDIETRERWRLNERHYGALQGLDKQETVDKHGKDQVLVWRRSYDIPPPDIEDLSSEFNPRNDPLYKDVDPSELPLTESLKLTEARVLELWNKELVPEIKSGKTIMIAAHGNSLRALVKHLDGISSDEITGLNIPTAIPLVYELDEETMKPIKQSGAIAPLSGRYLGDQEAIRARIEGVKNQTK